MAQRAPLFDDALPLDTLLGRAEAQMARMDYAEAIALYRRVMRRHDVVPASVCYSLGRALYATKDFMRALRYLDYYLHQASKTQDKYALALALRDSARYHQGRIEACMLCDAHGWRYIRDARCDGTGYERRLCATCAGAKIRNCAACYGQGVLIRVNVFAKVLYHTCSICEGRGYVRCDVCKATGYIQSPCVDCGGTGRIKTNLRCTHTNP